MSARPPRRMKDLFCGLGGASAAFRDAGWQVETLDVEPLFKPELLFDIRAYDPDEERPEFVWASPPCVEFARRRFEPNLKPSVELVIHTKRVIDKLNPRYWCVENVRLSVPFISRILGPHRLTVGPYFLWGNFPRFLPSPVSSKGGARGPHWLRQATRAKIPLALSSDMERAVSYVLRAEESGGRPGSAEAWQRHLPLDPAAPAAWPPSGLAARPTAEA